MKYKVEFLTLVISTILSAVITGTIESNIAHDPVILLIYGLIIVAANYFFECIHANKRAIFGGEAKPILMEVALASVITFSILFTLLMIVPENTYITPLLCSISIILGYIISYVRFKGKKGVYVLLFTSNKKIKERTPLYQFESIYDKDDIKLLDILILYGYVSLKEVEDAKLIFKTTNLPTVEEVLLQCGEISSVDIEEAEYLLEKYKETNLFMTKDEFRNYKIERQIALDRLKGE